MILTKSQLKEHLTSGNHELVIQILLVLSPNLDSIQLENEIVHSSERFYRIEKNYAEGLISNNEFNLEKNKLNYSILTIIDNLTVNTIEVPDVELSKIRSKSKNKQPTKPNWPRYIGLAAVILVSIWYFAFKNTYPISKVPEKQQSVQQETMDSLKYHIAITDTISKEVESHSSKNKKTNINVKDKAKVGIISTGDSAVFNNVKQDF